MKFKFPFIKNAVTYIHMYVICVHPRQGKAILINTLLFLVINSKKSLSFG